MTRIKSYSKAIAEAVAPYGAAAASGPHTKLSISLPSELVELVREAAAAGGTSVSATIAAALRRTLVEVDQERLERALELDAEESLAWANAYLPVTAKSWSEIEW
jgi:Arc/MetJ-type ribon-helix-helix transcriptional regulator